MKHFRLRLFLFLLFLAAVMVLACGSPIVPPANCGLAAAGPSSNSALESITLCPATADARNYPGGQVQFVATGYYSEPPIVTPIAPQVWGACSQNAPISVVSVTGKGLAQCLEGASGTYTVFASVGTNCNVIGPCGAGCQITGTAQLTCP